MKGLLDHIIFTLEQALVWIFYFLLGPLSLFSKKLKKQNFWLRTLPNTPQNSWVFFCSSAGEYKQAESLAKQLKSRTPSAHIHFFIFSTSGTKFIASLKEKPVGTCCLTPILGYWAWKRHFNSIKPRGVFFIRGELWPGAIAASGTAADNYLVNFHKPTSNVWIYKWIFSHFGRVFSVGKVPKSLASFVDEDTGDTKFDSFDTACIATPKFICLGSIWKEDVDFLFSKPGFKSSRPVLAFPHDLSNKNISEIKSILSGFGVKWREIKSVSQTDQLEADTVYVCTELGLLRDAYGFAAKAYVGGGLSGALHNILEPLAYGVHTFIGSNLSNSPEAKALENTEALSVLKDKKDVQDFFSSQTNISAKECQELFRQHQGASQKILSKILGEQIA